MAGKKAHVITHYSVKGKVLTGKHLKLAVVTDLHNGQYDDVVGEMGTCDAILVVGDIVNRHRDGLELAERFLRDAPGLAPTFFSIGNHERKYEDAEAVFRMLEESDVQVLDNRFVRFRDIVLGGLSSAEYTDQGFSGQRRTEDEPDTTVVDAMAKEPGFHLLMCHHPEYYPKYVKGRSIDLTLAGHAHGGQVQVFGHGLFAPGQGLFPKYTDGFYDDGHLLVSRGMTNSAGAPRLWNPLEMLVVDLEY
ncbi:MAG: metallophosphoesterase [Clostridia bacterium]|nr:metallophosphoesterase [Clostridia bacterium]